MGRLLTVGVLVGLLAACDSAETQETPALSPEPPAETPPTATASETATPAPAPEELTEVDADHLRGALRSHPGRVLLVNVWSTYCAPCVEEMPALVSVARQYESQGLGLMLISADPPPRRGAALVFLRGQGAPFPSYIKTGSEDRFIRTLHQEWSGSLPATLLLDRERRVKHFWERPVDLEQLRPAIENALADNAT